LGEVTCIQRNGKWINPYCLRAKISSFFHCLLIKLSNLKTLPSPYTSL
jgi:hypothetical protein